MRIALVVHDLHEQGGHSLYTKILADELSRNHEVAVFANRCERPKYARWQSHHVRAWRSGALSTVQTFPLGLRVHTKALAGYDIRHAQGYCGGDPNIVTAHICVAAYLNSLRSISLRNRTSLRLMAAAEERFYRAYKGNLIAISTKIGRELREFYRLTGPIRVIPHGVDASRFDGFPHDDVRGMVRSKLGLEEGQMMALYVGDLTKAHVHLKALADVASHVQFVILSRSKGYRWVGPNVRFPPPTPAIERYYAAADLFVFPTTYDAFGMVVLEAMASGLPVFTSDCAGAAELIRQGEDGVVAPLDEWVEVTQAALNDRERLQLIGQRAKQSARLHDWATVVRQVEQVYCEAISGNDDLAQS